MRIDDLQFGIVQENPMPAVCYDFGLRRFVRDEWNHKRDVHTKATLPLRCLCGDGATEWFGAV